VGATNVQTKSGAERRFTRKGFNTKGLCRRLLLHFVNLQSRVGRIAGCAKGGCDGVNHSCTLPPLCGVGESHPGPHLGDKEERLPPGLQCLNRGKGTC